MDPDLEGLLDSWQLAMMAERKSPATIRNYLYGVRGYLAWCAAQSRTPAPLDKTTLQRWTTDMLARGLEPATARIRQQAVRRYAAWLADPDVAEIETDPFLGLRPPKLDTKVVEAYSEHELSLLLKACAGKELSDRRDEAMLRLLVDTGMRAGELLGLRTYDVDLGAGQLVIRRGKGGRGRVVGFSATTAAAIDRYLRVRRRHRLASSGALWLSKTGTAQLGYGGLRFALANRATAAGVPGFHIHKLRHTFASRWLAKGGSEGGLMATAGWSSREMLDRYSRATASERAMDEQRRLGLGEL
jgi:site-specific recombinase XerD